MSHSLSASLPLAANLHRWFTFALLVSFVTYTPAALADVTTSGSVLNNPAAGGGSFPSTEVVVGDENDNVSSFIGTMRIDDGTTLLLDRLVIGDEPEYLGDVVVTGAGTTLTLDSSFTSNPALQVGRQGTGFLAISAQAVVSVSNTNGTLTIGRDPSAEGFVTVDGRLTQLTFGEDLIVGSAGYGELKLTDGALVYATDTPGSTATIGGSPGGTGLVVVDGAGTLWRLPETVSIGTSGAGILRISNDAVVDGNDGRAPGITVGPRGLVELAGGRLLSDDLTINGRLSGTGLVTGPVSVGAAGEVGASAGETLRFTGTVTNLGLVNVSGNSAMRAEVEFAGFLNNNNLSPQRGRIAVADGLVRFSEALTNDGTLASTSGVADFHGDITNSASGVIAIGGGSAATFYGDVDVTSGTLSIAAGSTALFLGDLSISAGATLGIQLDESALQEGFNTPLQSVSGATLDAPISLTLTGGFEPSLGDAFQLVSAAGGLTIGTLDSSNFATLPAGLQWDLLMTSDTLTAVVIGAGRAGDFNNNGNVDGADFLTWQRSPNVGDLTDWRANYGADASELASTTNVPEPTALLLAGFACLSGIKVQRRRCS